MNKKKRLAYLKEIDAHVGFHTGNGIAPQVLDLKKANDNDFVTNCNIRKVRNEDEQETYLRVNPNRNNNGYILTEYTAFKKVMSERFSIPRSCSHLIFTIFSSNFLGLLILSCASLIISFMDEIRKPAEPTA